MKGNKVFYSVMGLILVSTPLYFYPFSNRADVVDHDSVIFDTVKLPISIFVNDEMLTFTFDLVNDTTNHINGGGVYPRGVFERDGYQILVDYNGNGKIDPGIDRMFSPITINGQYRVCKSIYAYENNILYPCEYYKDFTCTKTFGPSKNSDKAHVIFTMTLPKRQISQTDEMHLQFNIFDGTGQKRTIPCSEKPLEKTLSFNLKKIHHELSTN
jgi:hypothetical protein